MLFFIIELLSLEDKKIISWEKLWYFKSFNFITNFLYGIPFKTVFITLVVFTLIIQLIQGLTKYFHSLVQVI